jgi:hypothetical protein
MNAAGVAFLAEIGLSEIAAENDLAVIANSGHYAVQFHVSHVLAFIYNDYAVIQGNATHKTGD